MAFKVFCGIMELRPFDIDPKATENFYRKLQRSGLKIVECMSVEDVVQSAQIITAITSVQKRSTILSDNNSGEGIYINAVGGDCLGKTELRDVIAGNAQAEQAKIKSRCLISSASRLRKSQLYVRKQSF